MTGLVKVLPVKVSTAERVTMTPVLGNVAAELMPVPPELDGNMPVTAADWAKLIAPKVGVPPPDGTIKL